MEVSGEKEKENLSTNAPPHLPECFALCQFDPIVLVDHSEVEWKPAN